MGPHKGLVKIVEKSTMGYVAYGMHKARNFLAKFRHLKKIGKICPKNPGSMTYAPAEYR